MLEIIKLDKEEWDSIVKIIIIKLLLSNTVYQKIKIT